MTVSSKFIVCHCYYCWCYCFLWNLWFFYSAIVFKILPVTNDEMRIKIFRICRKEVGEICYVASWSSLFKKQFSNFNFIVLLFWVSHIIRDLYCLMLWKTRGLNWGFVWWLDKACSRFWCIILFPFVSLILFCSV